MLSLLRRSGNNYGFSLLEVLVAITLLSMVAATALGLTGYHKSVAARVEARFALFNHASALAAGLPEILKEEDPDFPILTEDETIRAFTGTEGKMKWYAELSRVDAPGMSKVFRLKLTVIEQDERVELTDYIQKEQKEEEKKK